MLRVFLNSPLARPGGTIIGVEEELRGPIVDGIPDLLGRLDLLINTDDGLAVIDFKTSRSRWGAAKVADATPQLLLYSELATPLADNKPLRLAFAVLTKTKSPSFALHAVAYDPERMEHLRSMVAQIWRAIRAGNSYPIRHSRICPSCPFRNRPCRAWAA